MSQTFRVTGAFGESVLDMANGLHRVVYAGRQNWYRSRELGRKVAISLATTGKAPAGVLGLIEQARAS